jgi:hypothetical protein
VDYHNINLETCSEKEQKEIKKHIIYGYAAVEKMEWLSQVSKDIIISHHERMDGYGYPFHIKDNRIKVGSRIAAVCDDFDFSHSALLLAGVLRPLYFCPIQALFNCEYYNTACLLCRNKEKTGISRE